MCETLWECIKCPGKVACCCCSCALNMLLGIFFSFIVIAVIIGLIVYFTVYHNKDGGSNDHAKFTKSLADQLPKTFKEYFRDLE